MDPLTSTPPIHLYDTVAHRILCGVRGVEHRSTKHSRSVTCATCLSLLVRRQAADAADRPDATIDGVAP